MASSSVAPEIPGPFRSAVECGRSGSALPSAGRAQPRRGCPARGPGSHRRPAGVQARLGAARLRAARGLCRRVPRTGGTVRALPGRGRDEAPLASPSGRGTHLRNAGLDEGAPAGAAAARGGRDALDRSRATDVCGGPVAGGWGGGSRLDRRGRRRERRRAMPALRGAMHSRGALEVGGRAPRGGKGGGADASCLGGGQADRCGSALGASDIGDGGGGGL